MHALLSPSGASRWLACTKSVRLEEKFPDRSGEAAKEGTLAHELGELLISYYLKKISAKTFDLKLIEIKANPLYDQAMYDHSDAYATYVIQTYNEAKSRSKYALIFLEQKLDLTDYIPEGFGTGDTLITCSDIIDIIDYKYGKGVYVSAEENKQMMLYSLGALKELNFLDDFKTVRMTIYQPRLDNISTYEMSVQDLMKWGKEELIPKAALAFAGAGEYVPGPHCQFCKAKSSCKANADYQLELLKYEFMDVDLLSDSEIADILGRSDLLKKWLTAVEEHALKEAIENGKHWPGFKLVEGRSNRVYSDHAAVGTKLISEGFKEEVIYKKELRGITEMEKIVGKKLFATTLSDLIIKPPGKLTLVPQIDKRPEHNSLESAKEDFKNL